jgi:hypothetical protein
MTPEQLGTVGVNASAAIATVGFAGFVSLARFWRSRGGWHVFWYMLVIAWVLDLAVIREIFGDSLWFAWLRAGSLAIGMPIVLGWRLWIIFDLQLRRRYRELMAYGGRGQRTDKEEKDAA